MTPSQPRRMVASDDAERVDVDQRAPHATSERAGGAIADRAPGNKKAPLGAPPCNRLNGRSALLRQTRRRYSPVRVSISIESPVETNNGTGTSKPLPIFAGFITLPEVSPFTAGSV